MTKLFKRLATDTFQAGASQEEFVVASADFLTELNAIHPFREGNGRSQLAFLHLLGLRSGHPFRLDRVDRATFLPAMIAGFGGNNEPLANELRRLLA